MDGERLMSSTLGRHVGSIQAEVGTLAPRDEVPGRIGGRAAGASVGLDARLAASAGVVEDFRPEPLPGR